MEFGVLFFKECQRPYQMMVVERYFLDLPPNGRKENI
jgi:hypothetical protein